MIAPYARPCSPPLWARGGHAQTLLGHFLPTGADAVLPGQPGVSEAAIPVGPPAGDEVVIVDAAPHPRANRASEGPLDEDLRGVTAHLFHGLTGSSDSGYIRLAAQVLRERGARVRLFNHRGQGLGAGRARGLYHSGSWPDLFASIADARSSQARESTELHLAIGFSLSANTLLLGAARAEPGDRGRPDAVLAVNPPVDLAATADAIQTGFNRAYDRNFVSGLRAALESRRALDPAVYGSLEVPRGTSVRGFDERVTAPLAGYASADAYYADCSSGPLLSELGVPAVLLTSADDPFVHVETIRAAVLRAQSSGAARAPHLHVERHGGHLGYLARGERRWLGGAVAHYCARLAEACGYSRSAIGPSRC